MSAVDISRSPGVRAWLLHLREHGPSRRPASRSGHEAQKRGLTDWWVRHVPTNKWMPLTQLREIEGHERWFEAVDYGDGLEVITPLGEATLDAHP